MRKRAVFGLGNPGPEYANTRHNIGYRITEALAQKLGELSFRAERYALHATTQKAGIEWHLFLPTTYMNRSGDAVFYWQKALDLSLEELVVVLDELQLPLGHLRLTPKGSSGGHNGLAHVIERLGTSLFPRLRFGIDKRYPRGGQVAYVLAPFSLHEEGVVRQSVQVAADVLLVWAKEGLARASSMAGAFRPLPLSEGS